MDPTSTDRLRLAHVQHLARRLGFHSPILWVFDPMLIHAVGTFGEKLVIYHVIDNYVECRPTNAVRSRRIVAKNEEGMLGLADTPPALPAVQPKLPKPIIGYVGVVESNMNFPCYGR